MANQSLVSSTGEDDPLDTARVPSIPPSGPRKLIRPSLPPSLLNRRMPVRREAPLSAHQNSHGAPPGHAANSHAELFYFQKQVNAQTQMVFVLEDGERIEGAIEWYDTSTVKVRHGSMRTLIYKSAIKYLYKATEG